MSYRFLYNPNLFEVNFLNVTSVCSKPIIFFVNSNFNDESRENRMSLSTQLDNISKASFLSFGLPMTSLFRTTIVSAVITIPDLILDSASTDLCNANRFTVWIDVHRQEFPL